MPAAPPRSLWPREHGAYGQLGIPLVAALAAGVPGPAAIGLAVAAIVTFLAHEPALVIAGRRGPRARTADGPRAVRRLVLLAGVGAAGVGAGIASDPSVTVVVAVAAAALIGLVAAVLAALGREKTLFGEVVVAAALAGAATPVAAAAGISTTTAGWSWLGWSLGFAAVTCAVHASAGRSARGRASGRGAPGPRLAAAALALGAVGLAVAVPDPVAAVLPLAAAAVGLAAIAPPPRHLRRIGWILMAATVASGTWLVIARHLAV